MKKKTKQNKPTGRRYDSVTKLMKGAGVPITIQAIAIGQMCKCDNCNWSGPQIDLGCELGDIPDLGLRLDPGGEVPAGECPECGALAYLIKEVKK